MASLRAWWLSHRRGRVPGRRERTGGGWPSGYTPQPRRFDIVLTENMFGDILSDESAVLAGSIGMLPSASLGDEHGLYEPVHGSAPDIAGQNKANPLGAIGSVAAMFEYTFGLKEEAASVYAAIEKVLDSGRGTADLRPAGPPATTSQVGDAILELL